MYLFITRGAPHPMPARRGDCLDHQTHQTAVKFAVATPEKIDRKHHSPVFQ